MQLAAPAGPNFGSPRLAEEIVATLQEPVVLLDGDLRVIAASQAFFLRFDLERPDTLGCRIYDLGRGEWDTPGTHDLFESLAPRRDAVEGYALEVRFPGTAQPRVNVSLRPIREGRDRVVCYLLGFSEVPAVEREDAHRLMRRARRRSGDLVVVLESEGLRVAEVEGGVREITGRTPGELEGLPIGALLHPTEREGVLASLAGLVAGEPHLRTTFRIRHRDGRYLWIEALCHSWEEGGAPPLLLLVARDVSDRKRAEEALRWLGRQTKLILDSAADGIFGVDATGSITFINPAAARALGYRVPELLGRSYRTLLTVEVDERGASRDEDVVAHTLGDGVARTVRNGGLRRGDGSRYPAELACSPAREHNTVTGAVVTFRGIAERQRAEAAALRSEWLAGVGETTVAVRHEINNPLTTLLAEARLLEMGGNSPEEEREMVAAICQEARRIGEVIRRLTERQDDPTVRIDGNQRMLDLRVLAS